jgi:hypothetical protein
LDSEQCVTALFGRYSTRCVQHRSSTPTLPRPQTTRAAVHPRRLRSNAHRRRARPLPQPQIPLALRLFRCFRRACRPAHRRHYRTLARRRRETNTVCAQVAPPPPYIAHVVIQDEILPRKSFYELPQWPSSRAATRIRGAQCINRRVTSLAPKAGPLPTLSTHGLHKATARVCVKDRPHNNNPREATREWCRE